MSKTLPARKLTHAVALEMLQAAIVKAEAMAVPVAISIVDDGARMLAFVRMDGARVLAQESSTAKAMTAANHRMPTERIDYEVGMGLAASTQGKVTPLRGGLPIVLDRYCVGGIGCGSGTGEEDREIALAALAAVGAELPE